MCQFSCRSDDSVRYNVTMKKSVVAIAKGSVCSSLVMYGFSH